MNETENRYFNELRGIQLRLSASLQDPRLSGVNEVISNLYRDEAHFVYELLQNADDQGATHAKFLLTRHELVFIHNAPRHFSISNPQTHAEDKEAGRLGNVNSILSIASSSKTGRHDEVPIGKFGLGFKSVFVYTDRPEIYDDNIRFSISHFIVPDLLSCDHPLRKRQETLFRFPFKAGKAEAAYREIGQKLANLGHPLLFLNHLNFMEWETEDNAGYYRLDDQGAIGSGRKLRYRVGTEDEARETELWKFSRPDSGHDALAPAVVFEVEQDAIALKRHPLYCYLPTAGESHLPVILHAPFKLTGNRESIMAHDSHNLRMIDELASLLAASLQEICRLGEEAHKPWISDNLTEFLPPADDATPDPTDDAINLAPLTQRVLEAVREGAMLWCADLERYLPTASAFVADNGYLAEVYPSHLLSHIYNKECGWVLPSLTAEIKRGALLPKMLGIERLSPEKILRKISPDLLAQQPEDMEVLQSVFSSSGIVSKEDVENLLQYMEQHGVLERFQLKQRIEEQKAVVKSSKPCSLAWLEEVLDLRLKYVEAGEKKDIEFLVRSLLQAIGTLEVERDRDLRKLLPDGIHLLFGPPGTGKTTEITRMVQSLTEPHPSGRILILTPTNAAAGVLAERLKHQHIRAYRGVNVANSELVDELEDLQIPIYDADHDSLPRVLVSTVHYYAGTFALKEQDYLHNLAWDAIFIDEASMVTLDYVLLALFKGRQCNAQCEFYIVGDPLQLPAITNLDPFILEDARLDEFNFYSFIGLSEFSETPEGLCPQLKGKLDIRLLRKQYRSVPPLCEMMSRFAYQGMVQPAFQGPPLGLPAEGCSVWGRPLTFLRFPVTKAEGNALSGRLTDLDKLKGSNFHIYSALLVKEMLQNLFARLEKAGFSRELSIGIITPYTAQKKLLEKLMNVGTFRHKANVSLCVNTIHQFQGDEFDIVMLVLNPPNLQMFPPDNILINQRNLINVAISRAKHCLVVLYPDASCEVKNFLHIHKHSPARNIESLAEEIFHCDISELTVQADDVERELFGRAGFLAETSEVLLHEEVNYHEAAHPCTYRFVKGMGTIDILHNENPFPEVLIL